ncbi:alpha/beta fold hydrolase [Microbacterium ulmi]|uniref:Alpha/beta hydrolase n=1 Tax=Microbacterium ulmi TaxID=179095 RepID=A0A7Y2M226_9MICO|nr:alpha/beta hydrolase [Microbacterium ulmi]NII69516.1 pimeloyl-ACP methyl ester carboxylesterase [Microbacterium ulmi]NNH05060.1 alpha/beta hydrolase [Microbacterium ulmi]
MRTTIILVHGAFAESSSWSAVARKLTDAGHHVIAYANPLRSIAEDAAGLTDLVRTIDGPIVLAGHSYGGAVLTNVPGDAGDITALVYVAAFALQAGEAPGQAAGLVPGGTLGETLERVPLTSGGADLYIAQDKYHVQFCADLPAEEAALLAVTQRPVTESALGEPSGATPLWTSVPSWFIFGDQDKNIPVGAHRIMAERAEAREVVEVEGASHVVGNSHPSETAEVILRAVSGAA